MHFMDASTQLKEHSHRLFPVHGFAKDLSPVHHGGIGCQHKAARVLQDRCLRLLGCKTCDVIPGGFSR
jgi:hypothetical protein